MDKMTGIVKPELQSLPRLQNRLTFLYLEHCRLNRDANAITIWDKEGIIHLPAALLTTILLGPGTSVTHQAVELAGDAGVTLIWTGEQGVRYYASGRPVTHLSSMLMRQAAMVSNNRTHLMVARRMYQLRFPDEDVSDLTMQQLRGREGSRIRQVYHACAKRWKVDWNGRLYNPDDYDASDTVNKALSAGHACLYGIAHAVIAALGCSPGLGFVHVGHENSFVYDIADIYKAEVTIPAAFEIAAANPAQIGSATRRLVRDRIASAHILERMVQDIHMLLLDGENDDADHLDEVKLWNGTADLVANGINYASHAEENRL